MKRSLPGILLFIAIFSALSTSCSSSPTIEGNNISEMKASLDDILTKSKMDGTYDDNEYRHLKPACNFATSECLSKFSDEELKQDNKRLTESCMVNSIKGRKAKDLIMDYKNAFGKWPKFTSIEEMEKWLNENENKMNLDRLPAFEDYGFRAPFADCMRKVGIDDEKKLKENPDAVNKGLQELSGKYIIDLYADHKPDYVHTLVRIR